MFKFNIILWITTVINDSKTVTSNMHREKENITSDLKETGCEGVHSIQLPQHRVQQWGLVNMVMNLQIP
jgi:hypothetical protein